MEPNLSEYITEYWETQDRLNSNYSDEEWAEREDAGYEDRVFEEMNRKDN